MQEVRAEPANDAPASSPIAAPPASTAATHAPASSFDGNSTTVFQARLTRAPVWLCSLLASNSREKRRLQDELVMIRGAWPLLMKQRNGGEWSAQEKQELKAMVRSASAVSPYLFIWAIPGSVILLPFLAWFLDTRRKYRDRKKTH